MAAIDFLKVFETQKACLEHLITLKGAHPSLVKDVNVYLISKAIPFWTNVARSATKMRALQPIRCFMGLGFHWQTHF